MIPREYTCEGKGISPPLAWSAPPAGTATLALICEDPDAPGGIWTHWVLFNLPAKTRSLPAAVPPPSSTAGGVQGINSFQKPGYGGPCPPNGTHRYYFRLYALNIRLHLPATTTREQLLDAIRGHIIAEGALMGRYRKG